MPEYKIHYFNEEDGCTYFWDEGKKKWMKICLVHKLPYAVKKRVLEDKLNAALLLKVKI